MAKIKCPNCPKQFQDRNAVRSHIKAKHGGKGIGAFPQQEDDDYEESFADRAIQASLDRAMGVDNDDYDWLVEPYE